jgi:hypothetical protein
MDFETPLWNEDFMHWQQWSRGFRQSTQPLVEEITGITREQGAMRLFAFANFDWVQNPDATLVPAERMRQGIPVVLRQLANSGTRVAVTLNNSADRLLREGLVAQQYEIIETTFKRVAILRYPSNGSRHRSVHAYVVKGSGTLDGLVVAKAPQHPARIFNSAYARRCGRAIRIAALATWAAASDVEITELDDCRRASRLSGPQARGARPRPLSVSVRREVIR